MKNAQINTQYQQVAQVRIHYQVAGPSGGDPVVLLHGFPEFWYGWRSQIPALADLGYRVIVPDQRGYHLSDKPRGIRQYDIDLLARDVIGLIEGLGLARVHLAGHDWGGLVAWWVAMHYPEWVKRLAILNAPHPYVMMRNLYRSRIQRRRSWYILFFQLPFLPELALSYSGHKTAARMLERGGLPGSFLLDDIERYRQAWGQPRAWTGMINWYRAIRRLIFGRISPTRVQMPALIIWGKRDQALGVEMAEQSSAFCDHGRLQIIPEATHWVQHDAADQVNGWLADFFGAKDLLSQSE